MTDKLTINSLKPESTVRMSILQFFGLITIIVGCAFTILNTLWDINIKIMKIENRIEKIEEKIK